MNSEHPKNLTKLLNLTETCERIGVTADVLLDWNDHNILKPTITQSGEIGYSHEQVEQFLRIRNLGKQSNPELILSENNTSPLFSQIKKNSTAKASSTQRINSEHEYTQNRLNKHYFSRTITFTIAGIIFSCLAGVFALSSFGFLGENNKEVAHTDAEESDFGLQKSNISKDFKQNRNASDKKDKNEVSIEIPIKSALSSLSEEDNIRRQENQATVAAATTEPNQIDSRVGDEVSRALPAVNNYASTGEINKDSIIDEDGNIKGETDKLAINVAGVGSLGRIARESQTNDMPKQLILLAITVLGGLFLIRNQVGVVFAGKRNIRADDLNDIQNGSKNNKILELDQKMDGTVVIYFQGKEYRVSRPELYSESDHLIQRLMELTRPSLKEIDYQSLNDEKVELTTPLSKLVTRLGFVGIKRDLFFPRTSKERVFFRRFITEADLVEMDLNKDKISPVL